MLALSRRIGESIIIGDEIEITLLSISRDQVKLGIQAPKVVPVYRKEIYLQIQDENRAAMNTKLNDADILEKIIPKQK